MKSCLWVIFQRSSEHGTAHIEVMERNVQIFEEAIHTKPQSTVREVIYIRATSNSPVRYIDDGTACSVHIITSRNYKEELEATGAPNDEAA